MSKAPGWAVVANGKIDMTTVGPTRRSAIVNWLVTNRGLVVTRGHSDEMIEEMWRRHRLDVKGAAVEQVIVSVDREVFRQDANKRAIAALPELLAALEAIATLYKPGELGRPADLAFAVSTAQAAIASAKGES